MLDAGKAKSLAVMSEKRNPTFPNVPTLKEASGSTGRRGLARHRRAQGPAGECRVKLEAVLKKIYDSKDFQDFMNSRGFGVKWADGAGHSPGSWPRPTRRWAQP